MDESDAEFDFSCPSPESRDSSNNDAAPKHYELDIPEGFRNCFQEVGEKHVERAPFTENSVAIEVSRSPDVSHLKALAMISPICVTPQRKRNPISQPVFPLAMKWSSR